MAVAGMQFAWNLVLPPSNVLPEPCYSCQPHSDKFSSDHQPLRPCCRPVYAGPGLVC